MYAVFTFIKGLNFRAPVVSRPSGKGGGILVILNGLRVLGRYAGLRASGKKRPTNN